MISRELKLPPKINPEVEAEILSDLEDTWWDEEDNPIPADAFIDGVDEPDGASEHLSGMLGTSDQEVSSIDSEMAGNVYTVLAAMTDSTKELKSQQTSTGSTALYNVGGMQVAIARNEDDAVAVLGVKKSDKSKMVSMIQQYLDEKGIVAGYEESLIHQVRNGAAPGSVVNTVVEGKDSVQNITAMKQLSAPLGLKWESNPWPPGTMTTKYKKKNLMYSYDEDRLYIMRRSEGVNSTRSDKGISKSFEMLKSWLAKYAK